MAKIGIIGAGSIGSALIKYIANALNDKISNIYLFDVDEDKTDETASKSDMVEVLSSIEEVVDASDLIVEAASPKVVPEFLSMIIEKEKDAMVMSIGGILGKEDLLLKAREKNIKVMLPSGAIAGIDALKASRIAGLKSVTITTRKAPKSVKGAPYLETNNIDIDSIDKETVIFEGNAREAMKGFPKNINVSALLSVAGMGADKTSVRIIVSPDFTSNSHEVEIKSNAGSVTALTENTPSPDNPKTSYLAALAAMSSVSNYFDTVRIGT